MDKGRGSQGGHASQSSSRNFHRGSADSCPALSSGRAGRTERGKQGIFWNLPPAQAPRCPGVPEAPITPFEGFWVVLAPSLPRAVALTLSHLMWKVAQLWALTAVGGRGALLPSGGKSHFASDPQKVVLIGLRLGQPPARWPERLTFIPDMAQHTLPPWSKLVGTR